MNKSQWFLHKKVIVLRKILSLELVLPKWQPSMTSSKVTINFNHLMRWSQDRDQYHHHPLAAFSTESVLQFPTSLDNLHLPKISSRMVQEDQVCFLRVTLHTLTQCNQLFSLTLLVFLRLIIVLRVLSWIRVLCFQVPIHLNYSKMQTTSNNLRRDLCFRTVSLQCRVH